MTRRPILIGIAAVLALALMTGFAYGSGRVQGSQAQRIHSAQQFGTTPVAHGYGWNHGHGSQMWRYGPMFQHQMRDWMNAWMRDHHQDGYRSGTNSRQGSNGPSGYQGGTTYGGSPSYHHWTVHHMDHMAYNGSQGGYGYSGDRHGDCW